MPEIRPSAGFSGLITTHVRAQTETANSVPTRIIALTMITSAYTLLHEEYAAKRTESDKNVTPAIVNIHLTTQKDAAI